MYSFVRWPPYTTCTQRVLPLFNSFGGLALYQLVKCHSGHLTYLFDGLARIDLNMAAILAGGFVRHIFISQHFDIWLRSAVLAVPRPRMVLDSPLGGLVAVS